MQRKIKKLRDEKIENKMQRKIKNQQPQSELMIENQKLEMKTRIQKSWEGVGIRVWMQNLGSKMQSKMETQAKSEPSQRFHHGFSITDAARRKLNSLMT